MARLIGSTQRTRTCESEGLREVAGVARVKATIFMREKLGGQEPVSSLGLFVVAKV